MTNKICIIFLLCVFSCDSLDVENLAQPIKEQVLLTPDDYRSTLDGAAYQWFNALFKPEPLLTFLVAADVGTSSWGFHGMREVGTVKEPYGLGAHFPIDNSVTAAYPEFLEIPYNGLYSCITGANDIIKALSTLKIDQETINQYNAYAFFLRALGFGYLGLLFDQALIYDENTDLETLTYEDFVSYTQVIDHALKDFDTALDYAKKTKSIQINGFNGITINKEQLIQLINGYYAKMMIHSARTVAETNAIDWHQVLERINDGNLDFDFIALGNGDRWYNAHLRSHNPDLVRVDQKIVHMVNPQSPHPYPENGYPSDQDIMPTLDARWGSTEDHMYRYAGAAPFRANRGIYFFSTWKFNEHESFRLAGGIGPMPLYKSTEAQLFKAEALIRLGIDVEQAASIINQTRVTKGKKEPAKATDLDLLDELFYERYLETIDAIANGFFDRRRTDDLGLKQFLHFPVPARNLQTWGAEIYTTGG